MAYNAVKEYWKPAVITTLVFMLISAVASCFNQFASESATGFFMALLGLAAVIGITIPASYAYTVTMLDFYRGEREGALQNMINFLKNDYKRCFSVGGWVALYTFLWSLLFIIPGIIKGLSYSMAPFIAKENPNLTAEEAIQASMKIMDGNKMKLFLLFLGFIGWILLGMITFGIAFLFVTPYMQLAEAAFYEDLMAGKSISVKDDVEEVATEVVK